MTHQLIVVIGIVKTVMISMRTPVLLALMEHIFAMEVVVVIAPQGI